MKYDDLLISSSALGPQASMKRATATYVPHDDPFLVREKNYDRQYAQLYFYRLLKIRPSVEAAAKQRWPGVPEVRVMDAQEGADCVLIGTLYKDMKLKPSILDEYVKDKSTQQHLGEEGRRGVVWGTVGQRPCEVCMAFSQYLTAEDGLAREK